MKEIVDYAALNKRAGVRSAVLTKLVETMADLPSIRLAAERLNHFYGRIVDIREGLDDEACAVLDKRVQEALGLFQSTRTTLVARTMALTNDEHTSDMFHETLMLMRASGIVIDLGFDYDKLGPNDPVWIPPKGSVPEIWFYPEKGHWVCTDRAESIEYTGHSPTSAYVAWRQGREWVAEPDTVPPPIPPMPTMPK